MQMDQAQPMMSAQNKSQRPSLLQQPEIKSSINSPNANCGICQKYISSSKTFIPCSNCISKIEYPYHNMLNPKHSPQLSKYKVSKPNISINSYSRSSSSTSTDILSALNNENIFQTNTSSKLQFSPAHSLATSPQSNTENSNPRSPVLSTEVSLMAEKNSQLQKTIESLSSEIKALKSTNKSSLTFANMFAITSTQMSTLIKESFQESLPPREVVETLVDSFFSKNSNQRHLIHKPTFETQHAAFWTLHDAQDFHKIDPFWISLLFIILASSTQWLTKSYIQSNPMLESFFFKFENADALHDMFFQTARRVRAAYLMTDDPHRNDRLIRLQILCLAMNYLRSVGCFELIDIDFLPEAISTALSMNLDSPYSYKNPSLTVLEIELRKRIWWDICAWDSNRGLSKGRRSFLMSWVSKVDFPKNCDDSDLDFYHCFEKSNDKWCVTSHSIIRYRVLKVISGIYTLRNDRGNLGDIFNKVYEIDTAMHSILQDNSLKYQGNIELKTSFDENTPMLHIQENLIRYHTHRAQLYIHFAHLKVKTCPALIICMTSLYHVIMKFLNLVRLNPELYNMTSVWQNIQEHVVKCLTLRVIVCKDFKFINQTVKDDYKNCIEMFTKLVNLRKDEDQRTQLSNFLNIIGRYFESLEVNKTSRRINVNFLISEDDDPLIAPKFATIGGGIDLGYRPSIKQVQLTVRSLRKFSKEKADKLWNGDKILKSFISVLRQQQSFDSVDLHEFEVLSPGYLSFLRREMTV